MLGLLLACGITAILGFPQTIVDNKVNWKIVGGQEAAYGQFPYQISLRINGAHHCGGSILNNRWILTAAHCVFRVPPWMLTVVVGTNALDFGGVEYAVSIVICHQYFIESILLNDVALLKVDGYIAFGQNVFPIPIGKEYVDGGIYAIASGWGETYPGITPNKLQFIIPIVISVYECKTKLLEISETNICTLSEYGKGTCSGDSGGPLVANGKQIGIASSAVLCARGYPDVYARVSSYAGWIETTMALFDRVN